MKWVIVVLLLAGCSSMQRTAKFEYSKTQSCQFSAMGAETMSGKNVGVGFEVTDDCELRRKATAGEEGLPPE